MPDLDPVTENLLATSPDYRRLFDEHQDCKKQLEAMRQKSLPSQEDEQEMKRIKLHKLYLKDQMEQMLQREQVLA